MSEANSRPVAVVTGGNRGLGRETSRQLAQGGMHVIVTARRAEDAAEAAEALRAEGLSAEGHRADVCDDASVAQLAESIQAGGGRIDVLVNNAGVALDGFDAEVVRQTLAVNVDGTMRVTEALLPLMAPAGRVVMVSSGMGELDALGTFVRRRFSDPALRRSELQGLLATFQSDVARGRHRDSGWPSSAYSVSKAALNAYTRMLARQLEGSGVMVNAVCPGWVRTDMGGSRAPRSVQDGARGIVWAARLPEGGPTGGFFRDGQPIPW